jgi:cobalt-zinc-cadmium resistance protein CzcA
VAAALNLRVLVFVLALGIVAGGLHAYQRLDIEAYPNPVPPLVEVITQPNGWSAEEVERYVTIPLEIGLAGMPGLDHVRSQSLFGLSDVKCYFRWGTTYAEARQEVLNRLAALQLPPGMTPQISPWNAIGEVYRYQVVGKGYSLEQLRTAEEWTLERQLKQVPGVVDIVSFGGETREYHVDVDPTRLTAYGVSLDQLAFALGDANQNVGGQRVVLGEQAFNVRGIGLVKSLHDVEDIVITASKGTPVRVRDVATVTIGHAPRLGVVGHDDEDDIVQGIVLMRYGGETAPTLEGIKKRLQYVKDNHLLPPGMEVVPYYDRGNLVKLTTHTVTENLLVGMGLVTLVLFLFLGNARAAFITALNIPLALLIAFSGMVATGTPANLISLGAVDFGIVVDSTVIMMETVFHHLGGKGGSAKERVLQSAREVGGPMLFSSLIIGVAFLPLFTMTGVSGVIFSPMALTYAFAIGGALLLALTLTPALAATAMKPGMEEKDTFAMRALARAYRPLFAFVLRRPRLALVLTLVPLVATAVGARFLGGEFMPKLEEGNLWIRATLPTSISLEQSAQYVRRMREIVRGCPEDGACERSRRSHPMVETVVTQLGRPDDGTDVSGFYNVEIFAPLAPFDTWPRGVTKDTLTADLSRELGDAFPGVEFGFSQAISDNVEEAMSGIKGENSVKVIGPDLKVNEEKAQEIVKVMRGVAGVRDLAMFHTLGQPNLKIAIDRASCARYGLNTGDVDDIIQAAIGGRAVTRVFEGDKSFDLVVRFLEEYRSSIDAIKRIRVTAPDGTRVPLGQLAAITKEEGPALVYREDGSRYSPVKFAVRGRDLSSTIEEAKARVARDVKLPYDTHLEWAGQMNEYGEALSRFAVIVPLTLLLIAMLVYSAVGSGLDTFIVLLSIPVACAGGVAALLLGRINFSVSAAMGFISIFGIAIQDAILVVTYFQRLRERGYTVESAAREAAEKRLRPVLMTTLVATLGLLPAAVSNGIGAQTQKPLAVVVIGGSLMLAILNRAMQPPLLLLAHSLFARLGWSRPPLSTTPATTPAAPSQEASPTGGE